MRSWTLLTGALAAAWCAAGALAAAPPPAGAPAAAGAPAGARAGEEFFETHVRPLLAEHCQSCHGPKLQQGGLRLDTAEGFRKGTDRGAPLISPGAPAGSLLLKVVRHDGPVKMPPAGRLPERALQVLAEWVRMGAPFPETAPVRAAADPARHWAFQPVRRPPLPTVKDRAWVRTPLDAYVLARLERKGLRPSPIADPRALIRRASLDLTGLPPTAEEVDTFLREWQAERRPASRRGAAPATSAPPGGPSAYERLVDRLLASPRYGERWGRYWLDVARYADSKGYVFTEERRYPGAYPYRDYVVRAFNEDLPYDRFLQEQLAADRLDLGSDRRPLAAMGFLTLGRRFLNNQPDIIDDRIDVVFRGTQALTVGCARCHDHKFDPIPQKDYYSLYGVFASSYEPTDLPLIGQPESTGAYEAYVQKLKPLQAAVDGFLARKRDEVLQRARGKIGAALLSARLAKRTGGEPRDLARRFEVPFGLISRYRDFLEEKTAHPVFGPWLAFAALPDAEFAARAPGLAARLAANNDPQRLVHPGVAAAFAGKQPAAIEEVAAIYQELLVRTGGDQQLVNALDSIGGPLNLAADQVEQLLERDERNQLRALQMKVAEFKVNSPDAPPSAMVLLDSPVPVPQRVFLRGNPNNRGDEVPRQFLSVLSGTQRRPFEQGSGRLELARAIASRDNPLTARVMVNRVWIGHFGAGLVRTPSDFGVRTEPAANPELHDYLAWRFMEDGWSLKKLHRLVMTSSVYMQASDDNPAAARVDSENTLFWRMNRRRLDLEGLRDSLLCASGQLDLTVGGPAVDVFRAPGWNRRTLYGFIDRQNLPGLFRVFDFASPDAHSPQRFVTTVPQQALYLMNSPFLVEQARSLAVRSEAAVSGDPAARVRRLHRLAFGRDATPAELRMGLEYLRGAEASGSRVEQAPAPLWEYGYGEADERSGRVTQFVPLPHFAEDAWKLRAPDAAVGPVSITARGGHPGADAAHAVIRRWIAPRDGVVTVTGTLIHRGDTGDGVRARLLSSRHGLLGSWSLRKGTAEASAAQVEVRKGDTLDFVVDCGRDPEADAFIWAPVIQMTRADGDAGPLEWSASSGFEGPKIALRPLGPWERYAQVLLMSNEFAFID